MTQGLGVEFRGFPLDETEGREALVAYQNNHNLPYDLQTDLSMLDRKKAEVFLERWIGAAELPYPTSVVTNQRGSDSVGRCWGAYRVRASSFSCRRVIDLLERVKLPRDGLDRFRTGKNWITYRRASTPGLQSPHRAMNSVRVSLFSLVL